MLKHRLSFKSKEAQNNHRLIGNELTSVETAKSNQELSNPEKNILTVKNLMKIYDTDEPVVDDVSFLVNKGECFGLLGVNGAGKSTTFRMLSGEEFPTSGKIELNDENKLLNIDENHDLYRRKLGYCPQHDALNEVLTGRQMITLFAQLREVPSKKIPEEVNHLISLLGETLIFLALNTFPQFLVKKQIQQKILDLFQV